MNTKVKKLLSIVELTFTDRTVYQSKVLIELVDFTTHGTGNFTVLTKAYTIRPLEPGETDYGIMSRIKPHSEKMKTYTDEQIQQLFVLNGIPIITSKDFGTQIRSIMSSIFLVAIISENTFGLNIQDNWEFFEG